METVTFRTVVTQERIIRAPENVSIPQGEIEVTVRALITARVPEADPLASTRSWLLDLAAEVERAAPVLPADLAEHHNHYAHGKPLP